MSVNRKHLRLVRPIINPAWKPVKAVIEEDGLFIIECLGKIGWDSIRITEACKNILDYAKAIDDDVNRTKRDT